VTSERAWRASLPLAGPDGEPIDLWRTIVSHGLNSLPPARIDEAERTLDVTVRLPSGPLSVRVEEGAPGEAIVLAGRDGDRAAALGSVGYLLRLDEDLSGFYELAAADPELAWATAGAGRMMRGATVFEDVVKTICTTNCAWSGTVRMVGALVEHLGEQAADAPPAGSGGRLFPTPQAMAEVDESFYRDVVRAGYRGAYLRTLAEGVAAGSIALDDLDATNDTLPDDEVERRLLELPGVGPYAAAHVMMLLGRYSRLVLDSWTRPTYARLRGRPAKDTTIARRFRRYGRWAGLAFWLFLTRDWVDEPAEGAAPPEA
jgi:3-methyladenine DNA glycosylase/8-oxoguanine DNA glycosylase